MITGYSPYNKIGWRCVKAVHHHEGLEDIKEEWLDTIVSWTFHQNKKYTKTTLVHEGLTPALNCYKVCEQGWDYFTGTSLKNYLETGKGNPFDGK